MRPYMLNNPVSENIHSDFEQFRLAFSHLNREPFVGEDSSVGMEYELQVVVEGDHKSVDLPITIRNSTYFKNIVRRTATGDLAPDCLEFLKEFLFKNRSGIWENSWVRFPEFRLTPWTRKLLHTDFLADKSAQHNRKKRDDVYRFYCQHQGVKNLRLPVSYLLKLSLANVLSSVDNLPADLLKSGREILDHFISDNTSPEVLSFTVPRGCSKGIGKMAARETARTLLFCQLLVQYANKGFGLEESGQKCHIYSAPHAPMRQKQLNDIVPDGFYRQLFISPCLSGWDKGEEKHRYMELCHKILSRSQLNAVGKLKDAGVITNNLIVLPNTSNTCLANNGTHVSLGSRLLTTMAGLGGDSLSPEVEKYFGDLVIKITEHFLPLFVDTYSAAPYRLDFKDFHPEKVLGFLPHELDYTHLRMIWRRWKKKADISFLGRTITPYGPRWLDTTIASILRLKGDTVPDFRLIDYLVTLLSTETGPALNGMVGNQDRLKSELTEMGVFDADMSIYLPYRQRLFQQAGYAGFEGRSYSLFQSLHTDMADAVDMQNLISALASRYVLRGKVKHHHIPDRPSIESERRQIFFCSAIGVPTFYVRKDSTNRFMRKILSEIHTQRNSKRYRGYIRVAVDDYRLALLQLITQDGADLVEAMGLEEQVARLEAKLLRQSATASESLIEAAQQAIQDSSEVTWRDAQGFNRAMEKYYRKHLKRKQLAEGLDVLVEDCKRLEQSKSPEFCSLQSLFDSGCSPSGFVERHVEDILSENGDEELLQQLLVVALGVIQHERNQYC